MRTASDPASLGAVVQQEIRALDRNHTVTAVKTMRERLVDVSARNRFATRILGLFAAIALLLAALGVYGVVSLAVAQRRRELAVRVALGASRASVLSLVARESIVLVGTGGVLGAIGAVVAARGMSSLLYGVGSADPATYAVCGTMLLATSIVATAMPAMRAMRVHPAAALRE